MNEAKGGSVGSRWRPWKWLLWSVVLLLAVSQTACTSWHSIPIARAALEEEDLVGKTVRVGTSLGVTQVVVHRLQYPVLEGRHDGMFLTIDLNGVSSLQVERFDLGKTVVGSFATGGALLLAAVVVSLGVVIATWN